MSELQARVSAGRAEPVLSSSSAVGSGSGVEDDGVPEPFELGDQASGVRLVVAAGQPNRRAALIGLVAGEYPEGPEQDGEGGRDLGAAGSPAGGASSGCRGWGGGGPPAQG